MKKKEEIILTKEQEGQIDDFYDDKGVTAIKELVALIFPNIDEKEKVQVILVAISVAHFIQNQELKTVLIDIKSINVNTFLML